MNWVASREHRLTHPVWKSREADFLPLTSAAGSDSANLDAFAEFLVRSFYVAMSLFDNDLVIAES